MVPITETSSVSQTELVIPQNIRLIAKDTKERKSIVVPTAHACLSSVIKAKLESYDYQHYDFVQIPDISYETLTTIAPYLETIHENQNEPDLTALCREQMKSMPTATLFDLFKAAHQLEIKPLFDACLQQWTHLCKEHLKDFESYTTYQNNPIFSLSKQLPLHLNRSVARQITPKWEIYHDYSYYKNKFTKHAHCHDIKTLWLKSRSLREYGLKGLYKTGETPIDTAQKTDSVRAYFSAKGYDKEAVTCVDFSLNGRLNVFVSQNRDIVIVDTKINMAITTPNSHDGRRVSSVAFSPDSSILASCSFNGIKLWNLVGNILGNTLENTLDCKLIREIPDHGILTDDENDDFADLIQFSPNGKLLASAIGMSKTIKVWDVARGVLFSSFSGHDDFVTKFCFSPDSKRIASINCGVSDGRKKDPVRIWSVMDGSQIQTLHDDGRSVAGTLQFIRNGSTLLSSGHYSLRFLDLMSKQCIFSINRLPDYVDDLCLSPDGKTVAVGYGNKYYPADLMPLELVEPILTTLESRTIEQTIFFNLLTGRNQELDLPLKKFDLTNPECTHLKEIYMDLPKEVQSLISRYFTRESLKAVHESVT